MPESLFDTQFATEVVSERNEARPERDQTRDGERDDAEDKNDRQGGQGDDREDTQDKTEESDYIPDADDTSYADALITFRLLVSAKEAGALIGQQGTVIDSIRTHTNTKAGISQLTPGTHERILTVSGTLDDCAKALSFFAQALCESPTESYHYFPLKRLSSTPCVEGETTILRLLLPNAQTGTLIGIKGARIQGIQKKYEISMVVSKLLLPDSTERLVELQGTVDGLYDALRTISRCLAKDPATVETRHYIPRPSRRRASNVVTSTVTFPNDIVGALIGKNGSRIQGVRKVSGASIAVSKEEGEEEREFVIVGSVDAVRKAKELLMYNMEREEKRRMQQA